MNHRYLFPCALGAILLSMAAVPSVRAQAVWPPDDDAPTYTAPPQHDYPAEPQQYAQPEAPQQLTTVPQGYGQPAYQQPGYGQPAYRQPQYAQRPQYAQQPQYSQDPAYGQQSGYAANQVQPLSSDQLSQVVAPIALYPDALVAQVLTASTYPAQLSAADQWVRSMNGAPAEQIAAGAAAQAGWDPSVKALTAFPEVLAMLDENLQWATQLGNAYYNQPQDVLSTIQMLRSRAEQAGNLQPTSQEQVTDNQGYVAIAPSNPQIVYVPTYNPWAVYGAPIAPYPGFAFVGDLGEFVGSGIEYGLGFAMDAFLGAPFGPLSWGLDWTGNCILFDHEGYWSHSDEMRDWGFEHGGPRWGGGGYGRDGGNGGRQMARLGDYNHQPINVHGGGNWNGQRGNFPAAHPGNNFGNGGRQLGGGFPHANPGQQTYNRMPNAIGRPQPFQGRPRAFTGNGNAGQGYGRQGYPGQGYPGQGINRGFESRGQTYNVPRSGYGSYPRSAPSYPRGETFTGRSGGGYPQNFARPGGGGYSSPYSGSRGGGYSQNFARPGGGGSSSPYSGSRGGGYPQNFARPGGGGSSSPYSGSRGGGYPQNFARPGGGGYSSPYSGSRGGGNYGHTPSPPSYGGSSGRSSGGGFHMFGGGHSAPSYGGGGQSFSGGGSSHNFGGGGGGHSFGGGGGHSFGGDHSSGGGQSSSHSSDGGHGGHHGR